jgi:predicted ester cyclase
MDTEYNKRRCREAFMEFIDKGNLDAVPEYVHPDYVGHYPGLPPVQGHEGFRQLLQMYYAGFGERHADIDDMVAEGDLLALRLAISLKHTGEFMGIPATGRDVRINGLNLFRMQDGKAIEQWVNNDDMGLMQQLGVIPAPGQ